MRCALPRPAVCRPMESMLQPLAHCQWLIQMLLLFLPRELRRRPSGRAASWIRRATPRFRSAARAAAASSAVVSATALVPAAIAAAAETPLKLPATVPAGRSLISAFRVDGESTAPTPGHAGWGALRVGPPPVDIAPLDLINRSSIMRWVPYHHDRGEQR